MVFSHDLRVYAAHNVNAKLEASRMQLITYRLESHSSPMLLVSGGGKGVEEGRGEWERGERREEERVRGEYAAEGQRSGLGMSLEEPSLVVLPAGFEYHPASYM